MQEKLIILRKRKKFTQEYMANYLGLSTKGYINKELGRVNFNGDEMFALSQLFNEKIEDIFLPTTHQNGVEDNEEI